MKDKEILGEVHKIARTHIDQAANESVHNHTAKLIASFIEEEWQKRDEQERVDQHNRNRKAKDHVSSADEIRTTSSVLYARGDDWYGSDPCATDVKEIERHRGLEISEDGTVKKIL